MAAIALVHMRHKQLNSSMSASAFLASLPSEKAMLIQRVFRGYKVRRDQRKREPVVDPAAMISALDRHERERRGFRSLLAFVMYLLIYVVMVVARGETAVRFELESSFANVVSSVTSSEGTTIFTVEEASDVYSIAEALLTELYVVGAGEQVLGMDRDLERSRWALEQAYEFLVTRNQYHLTESQRTAIMTRAAALVPDMINPAADASFSCHQSLAAQNLPVPSGVVLQPGQVAAWSLVFERANLTGSRFPAPDSGSGSILQYSRLTGAMMLSMTRRIRGECDSEHSSVVSTCWSDDDADETDFVGGFTGMTYAVNEQESETRYYELIDIGTYGLGVKAGQCLLEDLQTDGWIGVHSKDAAISISLINPNVGLLARAYIYFEFTLGGLVETTLTVSSTIIPSGDIAGLWTLPFFILFVVFIVWTTVLLGDSIRQLCHSRGQRLWQLLDVVLFVLILASEAINIVLGLEARNLKVKTPDEIMDAPDPFDVLVDQSTAIDAISVLESTFQLVTCFIYLLALQRLLKTFQFHDRLNVITRTLTVAASDLFHFCIIFMSVTCLYSAICVTTFGSQLEEYHTFTAAFETLMRALLGDFAYAPLVRVAPIMGPIVFWTFIFVVFFILLNVFLSIVVDAYILVKEHASDVDGFLASMWGVITPVVARARLRVQLALQDHPCLYRLVSKRRLHPQAAKSINMRLHANFHRGDVDLGTSQHIGHVPGSASAVRPPVHASVMHAGEGGGAGVSAAGDAAGSSVMPSPILVAPAPSADKHSGPRPALHTAVMTFAGDPAGRPVLGAVYLPPRARELATPLRIMAQNKLARCTSEHHERITRVDVRKAIGIYFDKATVDEIMATFGKVPDEKKAVQRRKSNRTRAIYKELVHSNRRMNQKLNGIVASLSHLGVHQEGGMSASTAHQ